MLKNVDGQEKKLQGTEISSEIPYNKAAIPGIHWAFAALSIVPVVIALQPCQQEFCKKSADKIHNGDN